MDFTGISIDGPAFPFVVALSFGALVFFVALIATKGLLGDDQSVPGVIKKWFFPAIIASCLFALVLYGFGDVFEHSDLHIQVVGTILQFLLLIVIGGAVTVWYQGHTRSRELDEQRKAEAAAEEQKRRAEDAATKDRERLALLAMHDSLVSAYNRVKRVRRLVLARLAYPEPEGTSPHILKSVYDEQLEDLTNAQLDFESLRGRIDGNELLFGTHYSLIEAKLSLIGNYLDRTVKEHRAQLRFFEDKAPGRELAQLPALAEFLFGPPQSAEDEGRPDPRPASRHASKVDYKNAFVDASRLLRREINKRARMISGSGTILWVDDRPDNNLYETRELTDAGYEIKPAVSTTEAMTLLGDDTVDPFLIISDMGREENGTYNPEAGLELLQSIRDLRPDDDIPVYFYASFTAVKDYGDQIRESGGGGITSSQLQLFHVIDKYAAAPRTAKVAEAPAP